MFVWIICFVYLLGPTSIYVLWILLRINESYLFLLFYKLAEQLQLPDGITIYIVSWTWLFAMAL